MQGLENGLSDVIARIRNGARLFRRDLESMTHEMLSLEPGGKARTGYDIIFEVALVHQDIANHCRRSPIQDAGKGWAKAPGRLRDKEAALKNFDSSVEDLLEQLEIVSKERLDEVVETQLGPIQLLNYVNIVPGHLMYHSGQLNYIQLLCGDDEFHW